MLNKRYVIEKELGRGAFSVVMKGFDIIKEIPVAIKILDKKGPFAIQAIREEAQIMSMMNHPSIVKLYEKIEEESKVYLIMEFIDGKELLQYINESEGLKEKDTKNILAQILSGLNYIHSMNVMHRDIKAENFMITRDGIVKFIDFGLSKYSENHLFRSVCGTIHYCAPERVYAMTYSFEADIWSLGVLLYGMQVGYLPFNVDNDELLCRSIVCQDPYYPIFLSPDFVDLIKRILIKNPKERIPLEDILTHPFIFEDFMKWEQKNQETISKSVPNMSVKPGSRLYSFKTHINPSCSQGEKLIPLKESKPQANEKITKILKSLKNAPQMNTASPTTSGHNPASQTDTDIESQSQTIRESIEKIELKELKENPKLKAKIYIPLQAPNLKFHKTHRPVK